MSHEPFETDAAAYALGALDGEERAQFEEHLARGCTTCAATVQAHQEALADVARAAPPMIPPPTVKTALMRRVAATAAPRRAYRWRSMRWLAVSAAAVVGVSGFVGGLVSSRYEARIGAMARETAAIRTDLRRQEAALRDQITTAHAVISLMRDPATRVVTLRGLTPAPEAIGRVVWQEQTGGYLFVANLEPPPAGKAYELWTITGGQPRPAGVFTVDASGRASRAVAAVSGPVDVFAVTLEPEAGVPAPTGPMVLASNR